jgi:hypothetical protein
MMVIFFNVIMGNGGVFRDVKLRTAGEVASR